MNGKTLALSLLLTGALVAGCGRMGDLERPRTLPIGGGPSDPGEAPPQGALPDPYNNPQ